MTLDRRFVGLAGLLCIALGSATNVGAYRPEQPDTFTDLADSNQLSKLNNVLQQFFNVTNGRYTVDVTTTDPDGSRRCTKGELILYDPGASEELCVCVDEATSNWDCALLSD